MTLSYEYDWPFLSQLAMLSAQHILVCIRHHPYDVRGGCNAANWQSVNRASASYFPCVPLGWHRASTTSCRASVLNNYKQLSRRQVALSKGDCHVTRRRAWLPFFINPLKPTAKHHTLQQSFGPRITRFSRYGVVRLIGLLLVFASQGLLIIRNYPNCLR